MLSRSAAAGYGLLLGRIFVLPAAFLLAGIARAQAQVTPRGEPIPGVSKEMGLAIEHYEKGEDLDAMDRFMDVLTNGDPAERPMANEYMNLITQRMAMGGNVSRGPAPSTPMESIRSEGYTALGPRTAAITLDRAGGGYRSAAPQGLPPRQQEDLSRADRDVMRREIEGKIQNRTRLALAQLQKYEEIRIHMANSRLPRAIGMPASLLFNNGAEFKKEASKILETIAQLAFSLGATQLVLLPEHAMIGDAKISDMRRTMAVSAQLFKAGVAPPRVRVNLLASQIDLPKELQDYQGMILSFVYNQPLILATDTSIDAEAGPPSSIGLSPTVMDPRRGEGTIIEFSVVEPPAGLMSWKFQLRGPGKKAGDEKVVLQEVKGSGPVFHQIYWNGRKNYFGETLPAGRYEAQLAATDMRNHTRTRREWITVEGLPPAAEAVASGGMGRRSTRSGPPPSELGPKSVTLGRRHKVRRSKPKPHSVPLVKKPEGEAETAPGPESAPSSEPGKEAAPGEAAPAAALPGEASPRSQPGGGAPQGAPDGGAKPGGVAATSPAAAPPAGGEADPRSNVVNWNIQFAKNTYNISGDGESTLSKLKDTMNLYPLDNVRLVGIANRGEPDAENLSNQRANFVGDLLVKRHNIDPKRILKDHKVVDGDSYKVEIYLVHGN